MVSNSGYKTVSCNNVKSVVSWAHYENNVFCALVGVFVDTYVSGDWVRGYYNGSLSGGVSSTWTTESGGDPKDHCPDLHYQTRLVRES